MLDRDRELRSAHGRVEEPRNTTDFDDFVGYDYQSESPSHRGRRDLRVEGMVTFCFVAFYRHVSMFPFLTQCSKLMPQELLVFHIKMKLASEVSIL